MKKPKEIFIVNGLYCWVTGIKKKSTNNPTPSPEKIVPFKPKYKK
jgi:hypothetical protein